MSDYQVYNILDLIEAIGENEVKDILSNFSCSRNQEIQGFVNNRAIEFAHKKLSITYLVMDNDRRFTKEKLTITYLLENVGLRMMELNICKCYDCFEGVNYEASPVSGRGACGVLRGFRINHNLNRL